MTATLEGVDIFTEDEASLTPGTLCWVSTGNSAPLNWRHKERVLAVYVGTVHQWLLLLPGRTGDYTQDSTLVGWRLPMHLTDDEMTTLNVHRFVDSHRGWWPGTVTFRETAIGYWCTEHECFHAAETCPDETYGERISQLERDLAEARAEAARARVEGEQALEAFKVRVSDHLAAAASAHDLCAAYDEEAEAAGLYPRPADHEVEIEVTYRQTITVNARTFDQAVERIKAKQAAGYFEPSAPFTDTSDLEDVGTPYSLSFAIADE